MGQSFKETAHLKTNLERFREGYERIFKPKSGGLVPIQPAKEKPEYCEICDCWFSVPTTFCEHYLKDKKNKDCDCKSNKALLSKIKILLRYDILPHIEKRSIRNIVENIIRDLESE